MNEEVIVTDFKGHSERYDHVVMASHADQTLKMLTDPSPAERDLLGAFRYSRNLAALHTDESFMPKRRAVWSSWNYIGSRDAVRDDVCVTYWMNRLQNIESQKPLFVTLNPPRPPRAGTLLHSEVYDHPIFDAALSPLNESCGCCKASRTPGFAVRISEQAFTKTDCRRDLLSPSSSATCADRGGWQTVWLYRPYGESGRHESIGAAAMTLHSSLYVGSVMHRRLQPRMHSFRYNAFWFLIDLDELAELSRKLRWFSYNGPNAFSFYDADHGDGTATPLRAQVEHSSWRRASILLAAKFTCSVCRAHSAIALIR